MSIQTPLESSYNGIEVLHDLGCIGKKSTRFALFKCNFCGSEFKARVSNIKNCSTRSCGCYLKQATRSRMTKHGQSNTKLYRAWAHMKDRCYNPNNDYYQLYGGAGVIVCKEWVNSFESFYEWAISNGHKSNLVLDKDIKGDGKLYGPDTCLWITHITNTQGENKHNLKIGVTGIQNVSIDKRKVCKKYFGQKSIYGKRIVTKCFKSAQEAKDELNIMIAKLEEL